MSTKIIEMRISNNKRVRNAVFVLINSFGGGEFTRRGGESVISVHNDCASLSTLREGGWLAVTRVEYFEVKDPYGRANLEPILGKRYYYKVREGYEDKMRREFVSKSDIERNIREAREKINKLEADCRTLEALKDEL